MAAAATEQPVTTMPEQKQQPPIDFWEAIKVRRTRAMPKNTLFGSSLEAYDEEDRENIKKIDLNTQKIPHEMKPGRFQLPESVRAQLPAHRIVERSRKEIENQQKALDTARSHLSTLEREALLFNENQNQNGRHSQQYMNKQAMNVFKDMNNVGLSENNSYNRDKYRQRAPVHKYSLMGDVLRQGNEVYRREKTDMPKFIRNSVDNSQPNVALVRHGSAREQSSSEGAVRLPPNIRHQFGSRVCDNLLSDKKVVEKTIKDQERMKEIMQRKSNRVIIPKMDQTLNPEYESLGNAMRMNVFPGYTINHKISTMKDTFTDSVFLKRYNDPDQWRMQRDELSTWAEFNVIQERMKKSFNEYLSGKPTIVPNWDRNAKRPAKSAPAPETKPKPKPKKQPPKQTQKPKEEPAFEEVIFETPPVTPPPKPLTPIKLQPKSEKDKEFWDFYEKGGK